MLLFFMKEITGIIDNDVSYNNYYTEQIKNNLIVINICF